MTTKRRRGAAKKKQAFITMPEADGKVRRMLAGETVGRYIETLQRDAEATGNRGPLAAYYQTIADALGERALQRAARAVCGRESAKAKLLKRDARVELIRARFDPQPDRAACICLRVQVEGLLLKHRHVPPKNHTSQINEIVEALVVT